MNYLKLFHSNFLNVKYKFFNYKILDNSCEIFSISTLARSKNIEIDGRFFIAISCTALRLIFKYTRVVKAYNSSTRVPTYDFQYILI